MAMFLSDYFHKDFDVVGTFDAVMDTDSHYFINVTKLKDARTPEFSGSYNKINANCKCKLDTLSLIHI